MLKLLPLFGAGGPYFDAQRELCGYTNIEPGELRLIIGAGKVKEGMIVEELPTSGLSLSPYLSFLVAPLGIAPRIGLNIELDLGRFTDVANLFYSFYFANYLASYFMLPNYFRPFFLDSVPVFLDSVAEFWPCA